ncbi:MULTISPECIES: type VI secretion system baseplate subunit TssG [Psychrobacter]|uniref:type VI secretion system baseplate subunit TssG n=1 Tax=Psychrobacter TaxID=497 RepID=UPI000EDD52EC|nr:MULTISPECIES: type VI secretion system baseplate subunit TssG [Psychrobacter]MBE8608608.1 type VI secretion system baseplate subunit TssG [Pseudomonas lundensis]HCI75222.1 type VI secretion system baseplate subunit TssG [Psychrobacter sp.]
MSATQRSQSSYLTALMAAPQSYELLQALRLVRHEVSMGYAPIEVRYRASLSLAYPQAEIESMALIAQDNMEDSGSSLKDGQVKASSLKIRRIEVCPAIIGLTGPLSALPAMYTDHLASRVNHAKDKAAPAFLDLFNHRLTDLYVQASWFYNLPLQYEINNKKDNYLLSLRALARQPKKLTAIDSLIAYAGMIAPGRLTADQLSHVLSHFLDSTVSVEQFVPEWFDLPASEQTALGGQHAALGLSAFCGARVVQFDSKIRIVFHQLDAKRYLRLLPAGDMYQVIIDFIRKWCGVCLAVEMQLELDKQYITPLSLSESSFGGLGQGGFLISQPATQHHDDTRYALPIQ